MNLVALDDHMLTSTTNANEPRAHRPHQDPTMTNDNEIIIPADPNDPEDFPITRESLERGQRARLIRQTRTKLRLSQPEFATRYQIPITTLRDWEQARTTPPDFAIAYIQIIAHRPTIVDEALA